MTRPPPQRSLPPVRWDTRPRELPPAGLFFALPCLPLRNVPSTGALSPAQARIPSLPGGKRCSRGKRKGRRRMRMKSRVIALALIALGVAALHGPPERAQTQAGSQDRQFYAGEISGDRLTGASLSGPIRFSTIPPLLAAGTPMTSRISEPCHSRSGTVRARPGTSWAVTALSASRRLTSTCCGTTPRDFAGTVTRFLPKQSQVSATPGPVSIIRCMG
jgi:hypothetical protein